MEKKYQIFISSTYTDLIEAREKVRDAILTMMQFPIGMEMFSAADEEQWEIIQDTIDSSDYYVLIVGHRYGSVIETGDDAGISYTEKEFRYAEEKKLPILAFILSDKAKVEIANLETDTEKRQKLEVFKAYVTTGGRTVEWWKTTDELARKVTAALYKQMGRKKRPGWVRGDSFDIEASHAEILALNKMVRDLQEENANLKSKIPDRVPKLATEFILDDEPGTDEQSDLDDEKSIEDECRSHGDLVLSLNENSIRIKLQPIHVDHYRNRYEPLDRSCVDSYLESYVSDKALQQYNASLPTEEVVDAYIKDLDAYLRIRKGGVAFKLEISNDGTAKATDIRAFIDFPEEFLLFEISDIEDIKEPVAPKLPKNPIEIAEEKYNRDMNPMIAAISELGKNFSPLNSLSDLGSLNAIIDAPRFSTINLSLSVEEHSIVAETKQIPHRDLKLFDGIYVVPTAKGKFRVNVSLMCSEYLEPVERYIDVEVV